jgi:hypothetical protein
VGKICLGEGKTRKMLETQELEEGMSLPPEVVLHKYLLWCNKMRTQFDATLADFTDQTPWADSVALNMNLYMSYWYGGLYVVIEGWQELGFTDPEIDTLLKSPNVDLLRRYRNGVFHFQRQYFAEKTIDIMTKGQNPVEWVRNLNRAFGRYFLTWFEAQKSSTP